MLRTLLSNYPGAVKAAGLAKLAVERGQGSLLDLLDAPIAAEGPSLIVLPDVSTSEKVAWEREFLSFPTTPHPGLESLAKLGGQGMSTLAEVVPEHTGRRLRLPVLVVHAREIYTKHIAITVAQLSPYGLAGGVPNDLRTSDGRATRGA